MLILLIVFWLAGLSKTVSNHFAKKTLESGTRNWGFIRYNTFYSSFSTIRIDLDNGRVGYIAQFNPFEFQILQPYELSDIKANYILSVEVKTAMWRIIESISGLLINKFINTETIKCPKCKSVMTENSSYLYLLPVYFSDTYKGSSSYFINNAIPINSEYEIPSGRHACYMNIFICSRCGHHIVSVVDFLKVRDEKIIKHASLFPYSEFGSFFTTY